MTVKDLLGVMNGNLTLHVKSNKGETLVDSLTIDEYFDCECYRELDNLEVHFVNAYTAYSTGYQVIYISTK